MRRFKYYNVKVDWDNTSTDFWKNLRKSTVGELIENKIDTYEPLSIFEISYLKQTDGFSDVNFGKHALIIEEIV